MTSFLKRYTYPLVLANLIAMKAGTILLLTGVLLLAQSRPPIVAVSISILSLSLAIDGLVAHQTRILALSRAWRFLLWLIVGLSTVGLIAHLAATLCRTHG
jgi:hypothetical protein